MGSAAVIWSHWGRQFNPLFVNIFSIFLFKCYLFIDWSFSKIWGNSPLMRTQKQTSGTCFEDGLERRVNEPNTRQRPFTGDIINNRAAFPLLLCWLTWPQIGCDASPSLWGKLCRGHVDALTEKKGTFKGLPHFLCQQVAVIMISWTKGFQGALQHFINQ